MGPNKLAHPSPHQLAAFASGQAPEQEAVELSSHLADCATCRTTIDALPDDTLLSLLRHPPEPEGKQDLFEAATAAGPATVPSNSAVPTALAAHERYRLLELLGVGGMGAVYKAEHRRMERHVALKVISPDLMDRPAMVERFHREVKAAALLTHPNIVTAYDADQTGGTHFLVMEFVEGISLAQKVQQEGPLSIARASDYVRQAALGLQHAFERGMVHRDVKPHNLMLTPGGQVKILDFGLARFVRETVSARAESPDVAAPSAPGPAAGLTETGSFMGTADFIAPEQISDPSGADIRADIYSLGCTLYYLLTGHAPFPEGTVFDKLTAHGEQAPAPLTDLRRDVPPALARVVEKMMAKEAAQRYPTPAEVADALAPFFAAPPRRRTRRLALAAAIAALALLAAAVIRVWTDNGEFVIETEDDSIAVMVHQKGVKVRDNTANREYLLTPGKHRLPGGEYEINVQELPDGVELTTTTFTLKRGGKAMTVARLQGKEEKGYLQEEGLRWFPASATFFAARDLRVFPDLSVQQVLVVTEIIEHLEPATRDRFWKFMSLVGRIDRVSIAYQADPQAARSRIFVRATGAINHQRLAEWFRQEWPGVVVREEKGPAGEPITLIGSTRAVAPAFALIGHTDLLLAGYQGTEGNHLEVVRQALDLRAGRGACLAGAHATTMQEVPVNAWAFMVGAPPSVMKAIPLFRVLPRSVVFSVSGARVVEARLRCEFSAPKEAEAFVANLTRMRQQATAFLKGPLVGGNGRAAAVLVQTLDGLRLEPGGKHVRVALQVRPEVVEAVVEVLRDLPPFIKWLLGSLSPRTEKAGPKRD